MQWLSQTNLDVDEPVQQQVRHYEPCHLQVMEISSMHQKGNIAAAIWHKNIQCGSPIFQDALFMNSNF